MKRFALVLVIMIPFYASADTILLGDYERGSKLHKSGCTACHDTSVYTRKDRKIKTINGLEGQVQRCSTMQQTGYTNEQNSDIVKFLNDDFYKF